MEKTHWTFFFISRPIGPINNIIIIMAGMAFFDKNTAYCIYKNRPFLLFFGDTSLLQGTTDPSDIVFTYYVYYRPHLTTRQFCILKRVYGNFFYHEYLVASFGNKKLSSHHPFRLLLQRIASQ